MRSKRVSLNDHHPSNPARFSLNSHHQNQATSTRFAGPDGCIYAPATSVWSTRVHPACGDRPNLILKPVKVTNVLEDCVQLTSEQRVLATKYTELRSKVLADTLDAYLTLVTETSDNRNGMKNGGLCNRCMGVTGVLTKEEAMKVRGAVKGNCVKVLRSLEGHLKWVARGKPAQKEIVKKNGTRSALSMMAEFFIHFLFVLAIIWLCFVFSGLFLIIFLIYLFVYINKSLFGQLDNPEEKRNAQLAAARTLRQANICSEEHIRLQYHKWAASFGALAAELERLQKINLNDFDQAFKGWEPEEFTGLIEAGILIKIEDGRSNNMMSTLQPKINFQPVINIPQQERPSVNVTNVVPGGSSNSSKKNKINYTKSKSKKNKNIEKSKVKQPKIIVVASTNENQNQMPKSGPVQSFNSYNLPNRISHSHASGLYSEGPSGMRRVSGY